MTDLYRLLIQDLSRYRKLHVCTDTATFFSLLVGLVRYNGFLIIAVQRLTAFSINYQATDVPTRLRKRLYRILSRIGVYLVNVLTKSEILAITEINPGVYLSNRGHMVLGARTIGAGTMIHHCITLGKNDIGDRGHPVIGNNVWIGPHCVIYGNITIGDGVTILPGTVITKSVPPGVIMQGNPARVVKRMHDNHLLRSSILYDDTFIQAALSHDQ